MAVLRGRIRTAQAFMSPVDDACRNHFSILGLLSAVRSLFSSDSGLCPETVLFPVLFPYNIIMIDNLIIGNFCTEVMPYGKYQRADSNNLGFCATIDDARRNYFSLLRLLSAFLRSSL